MLFFAARFGKIVVECEIRSRKGTESGLFLPQFFAVYNILIFSKDPQYLPSFKGKYFCDSNELIVFLWLKKFFILSFVQNYQLLQ